MFNIALILLVVVGLVLIAAILLQAGQGGGLSAQFGGAASTDAFVGSRQATTILHKASWWGGAIFLFLSFVMGLASSRANRPRSILEDQFRQQQQEAPAPLQPLPLNSAPAPAQGGQKAAPPAGNAQPATPAPPAR
jgi:protein translocase SecG subunit